MLKYRGIGFCMYFDAAIRQIPNPASNAQT
jgi:hypothetical protein